MNLFFREKAFWTYARGQRLGDLRRLIRVYGRAADGSDTFPSGTFFKGGTYGADVNFPMTVDETNNPELHEVYRSESVAFRCVLADARGV